MNQQLFITLVDQILAAKTSSPSALLLKKEGNKGVVDTSALERQIDKMVYELYGLTHEEIAIVEGKKLGYTKSAFKWCKICMYAVF